MRKEVILVVACLSMGWLVESGYAQVSSFSHRTKSDSPTVRLTLDDAQMYAIDNNLTLANADINLDIAKQKVWETASAGLPQISASAGYQHTLTDLPKIQFDPNEAPVALGVKDNTTGSASLQQLIFSSSYLIGLKATKVYKDISKLGILKAEIEIRAAVAQSYYLALMSRRMYILLNENLTLLGTTLEQMKLMLNQGVVDRTQVDKLQVNYNALWVQVQSTDRQIKNTEDMLKYVINMPINTPIELTDSLDEILAVVNENYPFDNPFNSEQHVDALIAQNSIRSSELLYKMNKLQFLPTIAGQLGVQHTFNKLPPVSFQLPTTATVGVSISMPIFQSGKIIAQAKQARFSLEQSKNSEKLTRLGLDLQYEQAVDGFILAWTNLSVQRSNTILAQRVVGDVQKSVTHGLSAVLDLIQVNSEYINALTQQLSDELQLLNAKVTIDKLTNQEPLQR